MLRFATVLLLSLAAAIPLLAQPTITFSPRAGERITFPSREERGNSRRLLTHLPDLRTCHTMEMDSLLRARYPALGTLEQFERQLAAAIERRSGKSLQAELGVTIPVIVHVIHNGEPIGVGPNISAAQVASQIEALNEDYQRKAGTPGHNTHPAGADANVEFALARVDPNGRPLAEPGVHRINAGVSAWSRGQIEGQLKPQTQWDPERYLNIWTLAFDQSAPLLGYSQFPNLSQLDGLDPNMGPATTDGVVINYRAFGREGSANPPFDGGRTATHEIGHWLGLRHIWGDGDCSVDDFCDDTPNAGRPNYVCEHDLYSCGGPDPDMVENYMDYTNDGCMNIFTRDQVQRIRAVLERSPRRRELASSTVHLPPSPGGDAPVAAFSVDRQDVCQGGTVQFRDESTNNPTSWFWQFSVDGDPVGSFTEQNPEITFNGTGQWDVMLVVSNGDGIDTIARSNFITAIPGGELSLPASVSFEDGQRLEGWTGLNPDDDRTWEMASGIGTSAGGTSVRLDNYSMEDDPSGTIDALVSPRLNFNDGSVPEIRFSRAYATYEDADGTYGDTLALLYTTDCGSTWSAFWFKGGSALATAPPTEEIFEPSTNQWESERISLAFLAGRSDVQLAIVNLSGWGNALYLDDLEITGEYASETPRVSFSADMSELCPGDVVTFTDESEGQPAQWQWTFEGATPGASTLQNPRIRYLQPGTYAVTLRASNAIGSDIETRNGFITVGTPTAVSAQSDRSRIRRGESATLTATGDADLFFWSNGRDNELVPGSSITVTPAATTTYSVLAWSGAGCPGYASVTVTVDEGTSSVDLAAGPVSELTVSPNPAVNTLTLDLRSQDEGDLVISIFDMSGSVVLSSADTKRGNQYVRTFDVAALAPGAYVARVTSARGTAMRRFVKR